jgi:hypothetical protein
MKKKEAMMLARGGGEIKNVHRILLRKPYGKLFGTQRNKSWE